MSGVRPFREQLIDTRTGAGKRAGVRKAEYDIHGRLTGGEDIRTGRHVGEDRSSMAVGGMAWLDANRARKEAAGGAAGPVGARPIASASVPAGGVNWRNALTGSGAAAGMVVTDMRPQARDSNPHGQAWLDNLSKVMLEQNQARTAGIASGAGYDASKQGDFVAKQMATERTAAKPSLSEAENAGAQRAVFTDPKYGGSGVGYARKFEGSAPALPESYRNPAQQVSVMPWMNVQSPKMAAAMAGTETGPTMDELPRFSRAQEEEAKKRFAGRMGR